MQRGSKYIPKFDRGAATASSCLMTHKKHTELSTGPGYKGNRTFIVKGTQSRCAASRAPVGNSLSKPSSHHPRPNHPTRLFSKRCSHALPHRLQAGQGGCCSGQDCCHRRAIVMGHTRLSPTHAAEVLDALCWCWWFVNAG